MLDDAQFCARVRPMHATQRGLSDGLQQPTLRIRADHLKLIFPMCWAVTQIAWAIIDGSAVLRKGSYDGKSNLDWALQTLIHGASYLLQCHIKDDAFVIQVR